MATKPGNNSAERRTSLVWGARKIIGEMFGPRRHRRLDRLPNRINVGCVGRIKRGEPWIGAGQHECVQRAGETQRQSVGERIARPIAEQRRDRTALLQRGSRAVHQRGREGRAEIVGVSRLIAKRFDELLAAIHPSSVVS